MTRCTQLPTSLKPLLQICETLDYTVSDKTPKPNIKEGLPIQIDIYARSLALLVNVVWIDDTGYVLLPISSSAYDHKLQMDAVLSESL